MRHVRDNAFSLNIVGRNEDPDNPAPLTAMMEIRGHLVAFKSNGIFHIYTADEIDPERKHPQAKGTYKQVYDVGTASPFVSRTIIQASEMLHTVHLQTDVTKKQILEIIYDSMNELLNCHLIQSRLKREIEELLPVCDALIVQSKPSLFLRDFPQIKNLKNRFNDFFLCAKRFLQSQMRILEVCFGKPENGVRFQKDIEWAEKMFGYNDPIARQLRSDNPWMFLIVTVRNYIEHPDDNLSVELLNFEHTADNKFTAPAWRYKLRNYEQNFFSDVSQDIDYGVEDHEQLAHRGGERELPGFAGGEQALVEPADHRVVAARHQRRHVERATHHRPAAVDAALAAPLAGLLRDRREP